MSRAIGGQPFAQVKASGQRIQLNHMLSAYVAPGIFPRPDWFVYAKAASVTGIIAFDGMAQMHGTGTGAGVQYRAANNGLFQAELMHNRFEPYAHQNLDWHIEDVYQITMLTLSLGYVF